MMRVIGLNFHGIGTPTRELETGEAPFWLSKAQFIDILDHVAAAPDPGTYVLTFDDSNLSDHDIALPALTKRGLHAIFFVLTGRIGMAGSLGCEHVTALRDAGMAIGSHGIAHVAWPDLDEAALEKELEQSRAVLGDICGHPVTEAGLPFGLYNARVLRALHRTGYTAAFSSDTGTMNPAAFLRPRTSLRGDMSQAEIDAILTNRMPPLRRLRRAIGMAKRRYLPLP